MNVHKQLRCSAITNKTKLRKRIMGKRDERICQKIMVRTTVRKEDCILEKGLLAAFFYLLYQQQLSSATEARVENIGKPTSHKALLSGECDPTQRNAVGFNLSSCCSIHNFSSGSLQYLLDGDAETKNHQHAMNISVASCDGKCPSATIFNVNIDSHLRFCKCCRENGVQNRTVPLYCSGNGTEILYVMQEPTDCSCQWN
ncbi:Otogelin-like protein, partial [Ophiophagus hannah]